MSKRDEQILAKELDSTEAWQAIEAEFMPHLRRTREDYWASKRTGRDLSDAPRKPITKRRGLGFNPFFPAAPRRRAHG